MLQQGDLCYVLLGSPLARCRLAMYMHELPDAMIERYVIYVFSTSSIEYVTYVEAITLTEL